MVEKISAFFKRKQGLKKQNQSKRMIKDTGNTYLVLNKPKNVPFEREYDSEIIVNNLIPKVENLEPIGYYNDISEGLLLLSDDNTIDFDTLEIEYVVKVDKQITPILIKKLSQGVQILNHFLVPTYVEKIDNHHYRIALNEIMLNQVRRMTEAYGYHVIRIMRVRIESIVIDDLRRKKFRYLTMEEINAIKNKQNKGEYHEGNRKTN